MVELISLLDRIRVCGGSFVRTVPLRSQVNTTSDESAVQNNWTTEPVAMLTAELAVKKPAGRVEVMVATWPLAAEGREPGGKAIKLILLGPTPIISTL